jgi:hypothetical protein
VCTGKLLHFWANSPHRGGTWATLAHDHVFVSAVAWQPDQVVRRGESPPHRADSVAALALRTGKEEWPHSAATAGKGFAVVAGAPDARLAQELAEFTSLHVLCLLRDDDQVQRERQRLLAETNLYGSRVVVLSISARRPLPFVSCFANLIVVAGDGGDIPTGAGRQKLC